MATPAWEKRHYTARIQYKRAYNRRVKPELRTQILEKYGSVCARCGFKDARALQIDHVNGGGRAGEVNNGIAYYRRVLADTTGKYQILCANCNWIKRHENKEHLSYRRPLNILIEKLNK